MSKKISIVPELVDTEDQDLIEGLVMLSFISLEIDNSKRANGDIMENLEGTMVRYPPEHKNISLLKGAENKQREIIEVMNINRQVNVVKKI